MSKLDPKDYKMGDNDDLDLDPSEYCTEGFEDEEITDDHRNLLGRVQDIICMSLLCHKTCPLKIQKAGIKVMKDGSKFLCWHISGSLKGPVTAGFSVDPERPIWKGRVQFVEKEFQQWKHLVGSS